MRLTFTPKFISLLGAVLAGLTVAVGRADQPGDYLHTRTYIGLFGTSVSVGNKGEFTGTHYSSSQTPFYEVDLIPSIDQNFGYGFLIGHREEVWAAEVSYWDSNHTATFGPGTVGSNSGQSVTFSGTYQTTAVYHSVNVDFKRYFLSELQLQPFINLGVSFPWIVVSDAAMDASGDKASLTLAGLGLNLGVGVEYYVSPSLSFTVGAFQRWASFDEYKGFNTQYNALAQYGAGSSDEGSGLNFTIGTSVGFE